MSDSAAPPLTGADRIRALQDDDAIFQAFDMYPWTKDPAFKQGLYAILGNPKASSTQAGSYDDMAVHARIFYYAQKIGVNIDFAQYQSWLSRHPSHNPPDVLPDEYQTQSTHKNSHPEPVALPWQQAAPKADLYIDKKALNQSPAGNGPQGEPAYPMQFAEMIKLIQEGKPVPGIRQIPNTVIRDPTVKPVGPRTVPRKPWEKSEPAADVLNLTKALDIEFPPLESENGVDSPKQPSQ